MGNCFGAFLDVGFERTSGLEREKVREKNVLGGIHLKLLGPWSWDLEEVDGVLGPGKRGWIHPQE